MNITFIPAPIELHKKFKLKTTLVAKLTDLTLEFILRYDFSNRFRQKRCVKQKIKDFFKN